MRRRLLLDLTPLRESPAFRRLLLGTGLSSVGSQLTSFAVVLQVFSVTHSSAAVGGVGLAAGAPAVALGLVGGSVVDAVDRRRLVLLTTVGMALMSALLAAQAYAGWRDVWLLYGLVAVESLLSSVNVPARRTFLPRLLAPSRVPAGAALNQLSMHLSLMSGPLLAGLITAAAGLRTCYAVDVVSFVAALYGVARLPPMPPGGSPRRAGITSVVEGLGFIRANRVVAGALLADVSATLLGMPVSLFPAINATRFGGSARSLGLLGASLAVGGVLGTTLSGPVGHVVRQGRAMLVAGAVWGVGVTAFGLSQALWLAVAALVVAGAADTVSVVFRSTIVAVATPDAYRGRTSAAEYVVGTACPQLGGFRAGALGSLVSPTFSAVTGGVSTVVGAALVAVAVPAFRRYRSTPAPEL